MATVRVTLELPYTLPQDSTLFLLLCHETSEVWIRKLDWIAKHGGMALLDTHPDYMAFQGTRDTSSEYPVERYRELLSYVSDKYFDTCWHALPREVTSYVLDLRNKQLASEPAVYADLNRSFLQPSAVVGRADRRAGVTAKKESSTTSGQKSWRSLVF